MKKRTKAREELEEAWSKTETERKVSVAVLQPGSREIVHTLRDLLPSFTHL